MFAFLFGKKEQKVAGAEPLQQTGNLQQREQDLEKKARQLEKIKQSHHENAIEHKAKGNNNVALQFLKKEKLIETELASVNNMLLSIIQQRSALEQALINTQTLQVLHVAQNTIKMQQTEWSPDRVANLMDDIDETKAVAREINSLIESSCKMDISDEELLALAEPEAGLATSGSHKMPEASADASQAPGSQVLDELVALAALPALPASGVQMPVLPATTDRQPVAL